MHAEADLLAALRRDPADDLAWLALADCLEEAGQGDRAELVRLREWLRAAHADDPARADKQARLGELLLAGVEPAVPRRSLSFDGATMTFALVPPGRFWMGSDRDEPGWHRDETPRHRVTLTRPFWVGTTSVTNAQWRAVMHPTSGDGPRPHHPARQVLWAECNRFCQALGRLTGDEFRLPTEAEWECACRAGTTGGVYLGRCDLLERAAWFGNNSRSRSHRVAKKAPNAWGLYDVLGNVWDWCADGERAADGSEVTDPVGPDGRRRAVKGGAWRSAPGRCRAATRYGEESGRRADDQGFRAVMAWAG